MNPVDAARETLANTRAWVIRAEHELTAALAARDRAEAHLYRIEEVDNTLRRDGWRTQ